MREDSMQEWAAGPALDAEVARRIFDERLGHYGTGDDVRRFIASHGLVRELPLFSTDMAAAWTIVDHFRDRGYLVRVTEYPERATGGGHQGRLDDGTRATCSIERAVLGAQVRVGDAHAGTAALAICRAALRVHAR